MDDVNEVRLALFLKSYSMKSSKQNFDKAVQNFDASTIPPCKAELFQQLLRVEYVNNIWSNAHLKVPSAYDTASGHGWDLSDEGCYVFKWFDGEATPNTIAEIVLQNITCEERDQEDGTQSTGDEGA